MDAKYVWKDNTRKYQRTFIDIYTGIQFAVVTNTMTAEDTINSFLLVRSISHLKYSGFKATMEVKIAETFTNIWRTKASLIISFPNHLQLGTERWKELTE